jgi:hypothetical protein
VDCHSERPDETSSRRPALEATRSGHGNDKETQDAQTTQKDAEKQQRQLLFSAFFCAFSAFCVFLL